MTKEFHAVVDILSILGGGPFLTDINRYSEGCYVEDRQESSIIVDLAKSSTDPLESSTMR